MPENDSSQPRPRRISILAVLSVLAFFISVGMTSHIESRGSHAGGLPAIAAYVAWAAAPILGIAALIAIARSGGRFIGRFAAGFAIVASSLALGMLAIDMGGKNTVFNVLCQTNLKGLANALLVYAEDNDGILPESTKWCDLLVTKADISARSLICEWSNTKIGESSYAMNASVLGAKLSELPPDMVLLFEIGPPEREFTRDFPLAQRQYVIDSNQTDSDYVRGNVVCKSRWNEVCGIERADTATHGGGCDVLFANCEVRFVSEKKLASLRWRIDSSPVTPPLKTIVAGFELRQIILAAVVAVACVFTIILVWRCYRRGSTPLIVIIALFSTGAGFLFGGLSTLLYILAPGREGAVVGICAALLASICYAAFVRSSSVSIKGNSDRWHYAVAVGMAAGIIVSTLVHLTLMLIYEDARDGLPILAGMPFGILAGAILGGIAGAFINPENTTTTETTDV